jgi:hypothetical protein
MRESNGDRTAERLADLEEMDKLLLRAQVLHQRALEILEQNVGRHEEWLAKHEQAVAEHAKWQDQWNREREQRQREDEQWRREQRERDRILDERIANLVSAIGEYIRRLPPERGTAN